MVRETKDQQGMITVPNMVLIGSSGRNSGKTTLACKLIGDVSARYPVYALKVIKTSEHGCHRGQTDCGMCCIEGNYDLVEEQSTTKEKDTSKMLRAGAVRSFLLKSKEAYMQEAFLEFLKVLPQNVLLVCESNTLRRFVKPGVFLFAKGTGAMKPSAELVRSFADWEVLDSSVSISDNIIFGVQQGALSAAFKNRNHTEEVTG